MAGTYRPGLGGSWLAYNKAIPFLSRWYERVAVHAGCNNASDYCDYKGSFFKYIVYKDVDIGWLTQDFI